MSLINRPSKRAISAWRNFLGSPHGQEGIAWLKDQRPRVSSDPIPHIFAKSAGAADGFESVFDRLNEMLIDNPEDKPDAEPERLDTTHLNRS